MSPKGHSRQFGAVRSTSAFALKADIHTKPRDVSKGKSRMGAVAWGLWPTPRFPSPLIKPGVPISGTRLSDWLHRKAHGDKLTARGFGTVSNSP